MGAWAPRKGGSLEVKFPCTRKHPHRWSQGGATELWNAMQQLGLRWQNREKSLQKCVLLPNITFQPANKQLTSLSPDQRVGAGS